MSPLLVFGYCSIPRKQYCIRQFQPYLEHGYRNHQRQGREPGQGNHLVGVGQGLPASGFQRLADSKVAFQRHGDQGEHTNPHRDTCNRLGSTCCKYRQLWRDIRLSLLDYVQGLKIRVLTKWAPRLINRSMGNWGYRVQQKI